MDRGGNKVSLITYTSGQSRLVAPFICIELIGLAEISLVHFKMIKASLSVGL